MRGKKAVINTTFYLLEELVSIICGLILPRFILMAFGSKYNGLITSITQFLGCAVLLRSGIGGATRAALYKPMAEHNQDKINSIIKATDNFMKRIGIILGIAIVGFAAIYPLFVSTDFDWLFTFTLFIVIGASTFAESYFGITYLIILQADQRLWISSILKIICVILNTSIGVLLIYSGCSIHLVKAGSALIYVMYPLVLRQYVKKKYNINLHVEPDNTSIVQRWDAFWQQVATFVMDNTDVIILTLFSNMIEVSVYSVYNLIMRGLKRFVTSITYGIEAAFGDMMAKNEEINLEKNFAIVELINYSICTIVYSSTLLLIIEFVKLYTNGIDDANYIRHIFAFLIIIAGFFNGVRIPYQLAVQAAGHYKQTKKGAIIEPIINIAISIICVLKIGLAGVAIGTIVATVFRTVQYCVYMSKNIIKRNQTIAFFKLCVYLFEMIVICIVVNILDLPITNSFFAWGIKAAFIVLCSSSVVILLDYILFRDDTLQAIKKIRVIIGSKIRK